MIMLDLEIQCLILKLYNDPNAFSLGDLAQLQRLLDERKDQKNKMNVQDDQVIFNNTVSLNS